MQGLYPDARLPAIAERHQPEWNGLRRDRGVDGAPVLHEQRLAHDGLDDLVHVLLEHIAEPRVRRGPLGVRGQRDQKVRALADTTRARGEVA